MLINYQDEQASYQGLVHNSGSDGGDISLALSLYPSSDERVYNEASKNRPCLILGTDSKITFILMLEFVFFKEFLCLY